MSTLIFILNIIGVISFAAAGAMVAIDKETDIFGVLFLSVTTCFGGGMLRDTMISEGLPRFFSQEMRIDILICLLTALAVFVAAKILKKKYVENEEMVNDVNNVLDAIGLGIFASGGTEICLSLGLDPFVAIIMGMLSAVGGGMLRDIILRDIPFILRKRIYAVATDDNHSDRDACGGYVMINAPALEYRTVTKALEDGDFYASNGAEIKSLWFEDGKLHVECAPAARIVYSTGVRRNKAVNCAEETLTEAAFDVAPEDIYARITVYTKDGKFAHTNAYFVDELLKED
jgi:uncharacterized membrane protein YeiH